MVPGSDLECVRLSGHRVPAGLVGRGLMALDSDTDSDGLPASMSAQTFEAVYVVTADPVRARSVASEYRAAIRAAIVEAVPIEIAWKLRWAKKSVYPCIENPEACANLVDLAGLQYIPKKVKDVVFMDDAAETLLERSDGLWPAVERSTSGKKKGLFSSAELLQVFNEQVLPAQLQASTRRNYRSAWRQVITYGLAHEELHKLLPMSLDTLKSITLEFLVVGVAANSIKNVWSAIEHRHRLAELPFPLAQQRSFQRLFKAVAAIKGAPSRLLFPIGTHHVQRLLQLIDLSPLQKRAAVLTALGTALCCRVSELANLQMCDLLWDLDAAYHPELRGGLAVRIYKRKQDTGRFGLYPRLPPGPLVTRLRNFVNELGLVKSPRCTKSAAPGARCRVCDPVFPRALVNRNKWKDAS